MPHLLDAGHELPEENEMWNKIQLRSSKYLNNIIEQGHRSVKARIGPMLGFNRSKRAQNHH